MSNNPAYDSPIYQTAVMPNYRRRAFVQILIMNKDVTDAMDPHLISVECTLKDWGPSTAYIELDDRDASLPIPPDRASVKILMGWAGSGPTIPLTEHVKRIYNLIIPDAYIDGSPIKELPYQASGMQMVFMGLITSVESGFSRSGGGRRLWIECKSHHDKSDGKTPASTVLGEGTPDSGEGQNVSLSDFMSKVAGNHGFSFFGNGIMGISRPVWAQDNESFLALGRRLADEFGLDFQVWGNTAFMSQPGMLPNGVAASTVEATWGINLISWRIKPYAGRAQWKDTNQRFFDTWEGLWKGISKAIGGTVPFGNNEATAGTPNAAPNSQAGSQANDGMENGSLENRGTGWAIINGEPAAAPRGSMIISGARPGVDGRYRIKEAVHNYTRGGGYTTRCELKRPQLIAADYSSWAEIEKIGTAEIERQLQEYPFFMWQEGMPTPPGG